MRTLSTIYSLNVVLTCCNFSCREIFAAFAWAFHITLTTSTYRKFFRFIWKLENTFLFRNSLFFFFCAILRGTYSLLKWNHRMHFLSFFWETTFRNFCFTNRAFHISIEYSGELYREIQSVSFHTSDGLLRYCHHPIRELSFSLAVISHSSITLNTVTKKHPISLMPKRLIKLSVYIAL